MTKDCREALERTSLLAASSGGRWETDPEVGRHLEACPACALEAAFFLKVARVRPEPPPELLSRILAGSRPAPAHSGWWTASAAAAVIVLALGASLVSTRPVPAVAPGILSGLVLEGENGDWRTDDWFVAGAPVLEELADGTLLALAQEGGW